MLESRGGNLQHDSGVPIVAGQNYLLVVRADFTAGNDTFTLYVDPSRNAPEPHSGDVKNDSDVGQLSGITIYSTGAFALRRYPDRHNIRRRGGGAGTQRRDDLVDRGIVRCDRAVSAGPARPRF